MCTNVYSRAALNVNPKLGTTQMSINSGWRDKQWHSHRKEYNTTIKIKYNYMQHKLISQATLNAKSHTNSNTY